MAIFNATTANAGMTSCPGRVPGAPATGAGPRGGGDRLTLQAALQQADRQAAIGNDAYVAGAGDAGDRASGRAAGLYARALERARTRKDAIAVARHAGYWGYGAAFFDGTVASALKRAIGLSNSKADLQADLAAIGGFDGTQQVAATDEVYQRASKLGVRLDGSRE